jgi:undecaprenyl pyrophosphate synthase
MGKKPLAELLGGGDDKPAIRRGQGLRLSTEVPSKGNRTIAQSHNRTEAPKRVNRGYKLREDLIKACKRIALDQDRTLYDVMEEALQQYIQSRGQDAR